MNEVVEERKNYLLLRVDDVRETLEMVAVDAAGCCPSTTLSFVYRPHT